MTRRRLVRLAAILAAFPLWASAAEAQRPGAEPRRRGAEVQRADVPRPALLPDLKCSIGVFRDQEGHDPIPNGSEITWDASSRQIWAGSIPTGISQLIEPSYWVRATVINAGLGEARFHPSIRISNNGATTPSSPRDLTSAILAPESSKSYGPYRVGPLDNGTYTIAGKVITDVGNFQAESNETNNICDWQVTIAAMPTPLMVTGVSSVPYLEFTSLDVNAVNRGLCEGEIHGTATPPDYCRLLVPDWVTIRVKNTGTFASAPFTVIAEEKGQPEGCQTSNSQRQRTVLNGPSIPAGGELELSNMFPYIPGFQRCLPSRGPYAEIKARVAFWFVDESSATLHGYEEIVRTVH